VDPLVVLYATPPKDIATLVARMGELLYGERIAATQTAKIEKFLRAPLPSARAGAETPGKPKDPTPKPKSEGTTGSGKAGSVPPTTTSEKPAEPAPKNASPLESPEFKARVREALHAMMCLPEYQLN
jgi:hypothetical protein